MNKLLSILVLLITISLPLALFGKSLQKVFIDNINTPQHRAHIVSYIENNPQTQELFLIESEALGMLVYNVLVEISSENIIEILNKQGLVFFKEKLIVDNELYLEIDYLQSNLFSNQANLSSAFNRFAATATADGYLEIESNNTPFIANILEFNQTAEAEISNRGDVDFFKVMSNAPRSTWKIEISTLAPTSFSPQMIVYDPNIVKQTSFALNSKNSKKIYSFKTAKAETYQYIKIYDIVGPQDIELGKIFSYQYLIRLID